MSRLAWPSVIAVVSSLFLSTGCMSMISNSMSNTLSNAILNQDDPLLVRDGAPAYLLLIDGLFQFIEKTMIVLHTCCTHPALTSSNKSLCIFVTILTQAL